MSATDGLHTGIVPVGSTLLILQPGDPQEITLNRSTDARTAVCRGLQEYLEQLSADFTGRELRFKKVLQTWAEPEDQADYPRAAVFSDVPCSYDTEDQARFVGRINSAGEVPGASVPGGPGYYLASASDIIQELSIQLWCTDPKERMALVAMCEDAFNPVDWRYGFMLQLPHYHNMRAEFEVLSMEYQDTEEDARRRFRKALFRVRARMPLVRVFSGVFKAGKGQTSRIRVTVDAEVGND